MMYFKIYQYVHFPISINMFFHEYIITCYLIEEKFVVNLGWHNCILYFMAEICRSLLEKWLDEEVSSMKSISELQNIT